MMTSAALRPAATRLPDQDAIERDRDGIPAPSPPDLPAPALVVPAYPSPVRSGGGYKWSEEELAVLRARYPSGGAVGCLPFLPGRNDHTITNKARKLGLKVNGQYRHWPPSTEQLDKAIRRLYAHGKLKPGAMLAFCRTWRRTRQWVRYRAIQMRVAAVVKHRHWTVEEDAILRAHEGHGARYMQKALIRAGFKDRTEPAIAEHCRQLEVSALVERDDGYTASSAALALGVDIKTVIAWIRRGLLKGKAIVNTQGLPWSWRIRHEDLRDFLIAYPHEWHPGRCETAWLVGMLAGRVGKDSRERMGAGPSGVRGAEAGA